MADYSRQSGSKNRGRNTDQLRKRRKDVTVQLRKDKRNEAVQRRRNMPESNVTDNEAEKVLVVPTTNLPQLFTRVSSENNDVQYQAVTAVRQLLSCDENPPIDAVIDSGFLPILVKCLRATSNHSLQLEAGWALSNIAAGTPEQTQAVVSAGAVPVFIHHLSSGHHKVCEQALWSLGNIIGDGPQHRDLVLSLGIVAKLLKFVESNIPITTLRNATWLIVNLCRRTIPPLPIEVFREILPKLNILMDHTDINVLINIVWAIKHVTDVDNYAVQMVVDSGVVPKMVSFLSHQDHKVQTAAVRALGNIVYGNDEQTQVVLNCDALKHFPGLLTNPKTGICKETLWFLSNVAGGTQAQIQAIFDENLIPLIIHYLDEDNIEIKREAAWVVRNVSIGGSKEQVDHLVNVGVIPPFCKLLKSGDPVLVQTVLDGIYNTLKVLTEKEMENVCTKIEECGGLDIIESLQDHENVEIYRRSFEILDEFFNEEVDEDPDLSSETTDNAVQSDAGNASKPDAGDASKPDPGDASKPDAGDASKPDAGAESV